MVKNISIFILLTFFLSMQSPLFASAQPLTTESKEEVMEIAVDFKLVDSENNTVSLSDLKGKPVILFFWTTWCPFCRKELKALSDKLSDFQKDKVELLPINEGESLSKVEKFITNNGFPFRVLLDEDSAVAGSYDILGVPTYIYINKSGFISSKGHSFSQGEYQKLTSQ
ncbi:MAG: TlpA disulfide reductase family protein [Candidatus Omnitrophota bacterium]